MDLFYGFFNSIIGLISVFIGFKIYRPFNDKNEIGKEELILNKYGNFYKFGGILLLAYGVFSIINNI